MLAYFLTDFIELLSTLQALPNFFYCFRRTFDSNLILFLQLKWFYSRTYFWRKRKHPTNHFTHAISTQKLNRVSRGHNKKGISTNAFSSFVRHRIHVYVFSIFQFRNNFINLYDRVVDLHCTRFMSNNFEFDESLSTKGRPCKTRKSQLNKRMRKLN